jgi:(S)-mandelate dehydrogenase
VFTLDDCINLDDLRKIAKRRVPKLVYDFIEGGVDDEDGLARNEDAFRRRGLLPRYLVDVSTIDQSCELFGRTYGSPFGISPTGGIGNYRRGGDLMLACAARDANIPFIMSGAATASMEDAMRVAPEHVWYQLYAARDKDIWRDMVRKAADLGMPALVITVDVPAGANRERNKRNGYARPLRLTLATKLDALRRPLWLRDYLQHGIAMLPNWQPYAPRGATAEEVGEFVASQIRGQLAWADVEEIRRLWPRALIIKGIMRVDDAIRAADAGVNGLIVSNHGARQLDRAPSPLDVLPDIIEAVGKRMTLMLDGGIRRGADVLVALATGAKFVFLGRPTLYGCVAGGETGAAMAVRFVRTEVETVMAQIGCPTLKELGPEFLYSAEAGRNRPW